MRIIIFLGIMSKIKVMLVLVLFLVFKVVFLGKKKLLLFKISDLIVCFFYIKFNIIVFK